MIRPFTAVCVLLAGASGLYLYTEKHRTTVLDQQISKIVQDTQQIREHTAMLRAEWALQNQPDRLQSLAARFLPDLHPMAPAQFVQMASLAQRLPEVAVTAAPDSVRISSALSTDPSVLEPLQVMAKRMKSISDGPVLEPQIAVAASDQPDDVTQRPHAASRSPVVYAAHGRVPTSALAKAARSHATPVAYGLDKPVAEHTVPASRIALYDGGAVHAFVANAGVYAHMKPTQAAWHQGYVRSGYTRAAVSPHADAQAANNSTGSALGFSHAALAAPVPVQDGD